MRNVQLSLPRGKSSRQTTDNATAIHDEFTKMCKATDRASQLRHFEAMRNLIRRRTAAEIAAIEEARGLSTGRPSTPAVIRRGASA